MRTSAWMTMAAALLTGCTPDLESELRQAGRFEALQAFEAEGQGFAAALRDPSDGSGELTLVRLADGAACSTGRAGAFYPRRGPGDALVLVAWQPDGTIGFFGSSCQALMQPLPSSEPAAVHEAMFGEKYRHHLVIATEEGDLFAVEPFAGEVSNLSPEPVHAFRWADLSRIWLHRGNKLVLSDLGGQVEREIGTAVSEVVWTAEGSVAYVDGGALWLVRNVEAEPEPLSTDGEVCSLRALVGRETLAYLSPCELGTLKVHDLGGEVAVVATEVGQFRHDTSPLFISHRNDPTKIAAVSGEVVPVADGASLESLRRLTDGSHLLLGGGPGQSTLLRFDGSHTEPVRSQVARFEVRHGQLAVLTDLSADGAGSLWLGERADEHVASRVPLHGFAHASQLKAFGFIADSMDGAGRLEVIILPTGDRLTVAENVSEIAELRSESTPGLAYVVARGPEAGIWFAQPE